MLTFHKPENAMRRVEELRSIGQDETALQLLHSVVNHRRFRVHGWDSSQELMMIQYIILSVDLQKPRMAREGLHQYRYVTHQSNVGSLGKVIVEFRNRAEEQLQNVKSECVDCMDPNFIKEDLEQEETPESLLLASLQIERKGAKEKRLHETLRFTWEAYKMILDIIRLTPKLERIYHETAQRALEFCWLHNRASEFKTLCELLRSHYQLLLSNRHRPEIDVMLRPECHIETRIVQLRGAAKLSLWNECFTTAEEIFHLGIFQFDPVIGSTYSQNSALKSGSGQTQNSAAPGVAGSAGSTGANSNAATVSSTVPGALPLQSGVTGVAGSGGTNNPDNSHALKMRPSYLRWIALYYDILSKMFLLTENYSFHALAHLKYFLHIEQFKKNVSKEELTRMASTVVLAILSIPLNETSATLNSKSRSYPNQLGYQVVSSNDLSQTQNDQVKKAALLLGSPFIPTREILKNMLISKNILGLSLPVCRELYDIIEGRSNTLKLCTNTSGHLANLIELDPNFGEYTKPLKVTILTKLFLLISKVYSSINIDHFLKNICTNDFLPWTDTEKLLVQLSSSSIVNLRIDYENRCIYSVNKDLSNNYDDINSNICNMMGYGLSYSNLYSSPTYVTYGLGGGIVNTNSSNCLRFNNQITKSACRLETILRKIDKDNVKAGLNNQCSKISQMVLRRLPIEMSSMEKRIEEIKYRRKERIEEMKRAEEDKKRQEKEAKAQEELMEIQKREDDRRRREEARQLEEIRRSKIEACRMMLDTIKKFEFKNTSNNKVLIKGKAIEEITLDDLLEGRILFDDLERLQEEQCNFERQERIKQRKMEAKRLDHLARAYRLEEIPLINEWHRETVKSDVELNKKLHENYLLRMEEVKEEINLEKEVLRNLVPLLDNWKEKQIEVRKIELEDALRCQRQRCIKKIKDLKISRAKIRRNEAIERRLHEEEQKRREEEAKREEEEARLLEEAKRQKEEKRLKLQRQFEIQKKREEEIEAKLQAQANSSRSSNYSNNDNIVFTRGGSNNANIGDSNKNSGVGSSGSFSRSSNYSSSRSGNVNSGKFPFIPV
ncbi:hypothetical protein RS030_91523 [Cryptosporidium xiaoi]|uniref:PCI domain-containing protein n=1 Tax=Cryptosporidium xiaoi TaxID=659607 RepID=A0AAV9XSD6_9CRYT